MEEDNSILVDIQLLSRSITLEQGTSNESEEKDDGCFKPPPAKKACLATTSTAEDEKSKLEVRLGGILCCAVCLDLPRMSVFQCTNGHLMCAGCFNHLLADCRIKDNTPTCPNCRVELSRSACTRNLAVEKAVSELPAECTHCGRNFPRNMLENHEASFCLERPTPCQYNVLGCDWKGPHREAAAHEADCKQRSLSASEILPFLRSEAEKAETEKSKFSNFMNLLSYEKITFNDVQMRPFRTEEFNHNLYYETTRFSAFGCLFSINMRLNDDRRDTHLTNDRYLSYQLVLRGKPSPPRFLVHFSIVRGPYGGMKVLPNVAQHEFTETLTESSWNLLPLVDSAECNRLLANRNIDFRIVMSQQPVSSL
ncbi:cysteine and histidine-rich protein 1 homolog isoform X1 [Hyalella azteca]|uniref:Cysteine and histidine-rich protein 1 homolog isoform X1 n=1 Tax=Hyalella azteca TaxID=294128 RepID=A0A8B7MZX7_HYAAZ|nr:cysteine and histidine-rich protein 1 homolog isoform X2 [Hyalella azteca]XP_047736747.1 cysteine and histidine-rich protein 1 homolog isoform X1 [Hyalella azteca]